MFNVLTYAAAVKKAKKLIEEYVHDIPIATKDSVGVVMVGDNLDITPEGKLSVLTASDAEYDNTLPITSAAVYTEIGNINALLETI